MSTAVVTGAGSGIGRASAIALARRGLTVVLWGRTRPPLEETARAIDDAGGRAVVRACDVTRPAAVAAAAGEAIDALGAPRVLVNNAGSLDVVKPIGEMTDDEWSSSIASNLDSVFYVTRAFLPSMLAARCGRVVTVAGISSTLGTPKLSAYVAAKWGALGFMKSLAEEVRGAGVQALTVLPGSVDTPLLRRRNLFPPQMSADDVARTIEFAALDAPDAMNGSAIEVFGP